MGHSEILPLIQLLEAGAEGKPPEAAVQVWGDTATFSFSSALVSQPDEADADGAGTTGDSADESGAPQLYQRVGHLTRTLHNALRELGYHDSLADARDDLPDARERLAYIARLTGDAAEKVLNSVDRARAVQEDISARAEGLRSRWGAVASYAAAGQRATPAGQALLEETCAFLAGLSEQAAQTNAILTDIMMAQDFHDLTGQVIRKVVNLSQDLEEQLVKLLIETKPAEQRLKRESVALDGPVVNASDRTDVVTDQAGVDDLLASLGF